MMAMETLRSLESKNSVLQTVGRFGGLALGVLAGAEFGLIEAVVAGGVGAIVGDAAGKGLSKGF